MDDVGRRDFLKHATTLGVLAVSMQAGVRLAAAQGRPTMKFELKVSDVEFLRTPKGRQLMALQSVGDDP